MQKHPLEALSHTADSHENCWAKLERAIEELLELSPSREDASSDYPSDTALWAIYGFNR